MENGIFKKFNCSCTSSIYHFTCDIWYPRLVNGSIDEKNNWRLIGNGEGIHWPDLDEDISIDGLITGRASGESQHSLEKWLESRKGSRGVG